jgi:hypothetical protein
MSWTLAILCAGLLAIAPGCGDDDDKGDDETSTCAEACELMFESVDWDDVVECTGVALWDMGYATMEAPECSAIEDPAACLECTDAIGAADEDCVEAATGCWEDYEDE